MVRRSHTAVVEKNVSWNGRFETEPFEAGWAGEAVFFIRSLSGHLSGNRARVQISPDGMHWCNEGTEIDLPMDGDVTFCRVNSFGNWLRLAGETQTAGKVLVALSLKE
jgi:hypothetical protein